MMLIIGRFVLMIKCGKLVYKGTKPKPGLLSVSFPAKPCSWWDVGK